MAIKLSASTELRDTQLAVLAAAARRSDMSVVLPVRLKSDAARKLARALLDNGLVRECRAKGEQLVWRRDEDTDRAFALVLTEAGRMAGAEPADNPQLEPGTSADTGLAIAPDAHELATSSSPDAPRSGSKLAGVIALLDRPQGTSMSELTAATGWLPHTARAALTGLRKRGYTLTREAGEGGPVYRIGESPAVAEAAAV